jgi:hypothetical protein
MQNAEASNNESTDYRGAVSSEANNSEANNSDIGIIQSVFSPAARPTSVR